MCNQGRGCVHVCTHSPAQLLLFFRFFILYVCLSTRQTTLEQQQRHSRANPLPQNTPTETETETADARCVAECCWRLFLPPWFPSHTHALQPHSFPAHAHMHLLCIIRGASIPSEPWPSTHIYMHCIICITCAIKESAHLYIVGGCRQRHGCFGFARRGYRGRLTAKSSSSFYCSQPVTSNNGKHEIFWAGYYLPICEPTEHNCRDRASSSIVRMCCDREADRSVSLTSAHGCFSAITTATAVGRCPTLL